MSDTSQTRSGLSAAHAVLSLREDFAATQDRAQAAFHQIGLPTDFATATKALNSHTPDISIHIAEVGKKAEGSRDESDGYFVFKDDESVKSDATLPLVNRTQPFSLKSGKLLPGDMEILDNGMGLGRRVMAGVLEMGRVCGFTESEIFAASRNGGYTWARFGYVMAEPHAPKGLPERVAALKILVPQLPWQQLEPHLAFTDPRDIWAVADFAHDRQLPDLGGLREVMQDVADNRDIIRHTLNAYNNRDVFFNAGKFLLAGIWWQGRFDLNCEEQNARLQHYLDEGRPSIGSAPSCKF